MKEIEMYPGVNIDYAYEQLKKYKQKTSEDCFCKFNDKELYSSETLDEMYLKVTRKTKAEFDKDLQDEHNEYLGYKEIAGIYRFRVLVRRQDTFCRNFGFL